AKTRRLTARAWWRSHNMRPASWFQRDAGVLGRARHCVRSCRRRVLECAAQSARDPAGASNDRGMANDFRNRAFAGNWAYHRRKPAAFSLDRVVDFLFVLSGGDWFSAHLSASVLAPAADVGGKTANCLSDHAARRGCVGLGSWRRKVFPMVACWRMLCPRRRMDDLRQSRSEETRRAGRRSTTLVKSRLVA